MAYAKPSADFVQMSSIVSRQVTVNYALAAAGVLLAYHHEQIGFQALFVSRGNEGLAFTVFTWCGFLVIFPLAAMATRFPLPAALGLFGISAVPALIAAPFFLGTSGEVWGAVFRHILPTLVLAAAMLWWARRRPRKLTYLAVCGYIETAVAVVTWWLSYSALRFNGLLPTVGVWIVITICVALLLERVGWRLMPARPRESLPYRNNEG